jgi:hypothetical protein
MKWLALLCLLLLGCGQSGDPILFVLAGDEHALGFRPKVSLPDSLAKLPGNVTVYRTGSSRDWECVGPEWFFAHAFAERAGKRPVWIVKHGAPGTTLAGWTKDWTGREGTWQDRTTAHYGALRRQIIAVVGKERYEVGALLWVHPESGDQMATQLLEDFGWGGIITIRPDLNADDMELGRRMARIYGSVFFDGPSRIEIQDGKGDWIRGALPEAPEGE